MNKFQRHIKSLPESGPSFQQPAGVTVITKGDGWVRGVTRMSYPQIQQIPKGTPLDELKGLNIRHMDITVGCIETHS